MGSSSSAAHFAKKPLTEITVADVDNYRDAQLKAGKLSANSINKTIATLASILERAVEYEVIRATRRAVDGAEFSAPRPNALLSNGRTRLVLCSMQRRVSIAKPVKAAATHVLCSPP